MAYVAKYKILREFKELKMFSLKFARQNSNVLIRSYTNDLGRNLAEKGRQLIDMSIFEDIAV